MDNVEQTIISQYGNSAIISQLIYNMNSYIDPSVDIDSFYNTVWNIETASGFGLDIWGRIVNLPTGRYIYTTPVTVLTDDEFRRLILMKALSNISITSSPTFNQLLNNFFAGRGFCYVSDQGQMQMRYTFEFPLADYELRIFSQPGILLRPAGVRVAVVQILLPLFGFSEAGTVSAAPFGQAPFIPTETVI